MRVLNDPFSSVIIELSARGSSRSARSLGLENLYPASKLGRTDTRNVRFESTPTQNGRRRVSRLVCQRIISTLFAPLDEVLRGRGKDRSGVELKDVEDGDEGLLGVGVEAVPKGGKCCRRCKACCSNSGVISSGLGGSTFPSNRFSAD